MNQPVPPGSKGGGLRPVDSGKGAIAWRISTSAKFLRGEMKCKSKLCDLESGHRGKCCRVVNIAPEPVVNTGGSIRQVLWQQANRERYNAKMRAYMRKHRSKPIGFAYG